jgi:hypothetical protein
MEVEQQPGVAPSRMVPDNQEGLLGFGMSTEFWNPSTGKRYLQQGSDVASAVADAKSGDVAKSKYYAELVPAGPGVQQDPFEQRLTAGMTNFQVVAAPFLIPKLIPFAAGGLAVGESIKYGTTGQHLTAAEAFAAAGVGELVGIGVMSGGSYLNAKYAKPRVTESLTKDYIAQQRVNENILSGKIVGETKIWKPTLGQQIQMKITGAHPKNLASGLSSFSSAQDSAYSMGMMKAESASFDMGFSPRSSFMGGNKGLTPPKAPVAPSQLPLYFGLGRDTFEQAYDGPSQTIWEKPEKGLPENQLAYDYQGPLGFKKPTAFEQIQTLKQGGGGRMKPLWDSAGSKSRPGVNFGNPSPSYGKGYSVAVTTTQRASAVSFRPPTRPDLFSVEEQIFNYPSILTHPPVLGAKTSSQMTPMSAAPSRARVEANLLSNVFGVNVASVAPGLRSKQDPFRDVAVRSGQTFRQDHIQSSELVALQELRQQPLTFSVTVPQLAQKTSTRTVTATAWPTGPTAVSGFTNPGFKFDGGGYGEPSLKRFLGLRSKKKKYPILSAKEVLLAW